MRSDTLKKRRKKHKGLFVHMTVSCPSRGGQTTFKTGVLFLIDLFSRGPVLGHKKVHYVGGHHQARQQPITYYLNTFLGSLMYVRLLSPSPQGRPKKLTLLRLVKKQKHRPTCLLFCPDIEISSNGAHLFLFNPLRLLYSVRGSLLLLFLQRSCHSVTPVTSNPPALRPPF